MSSLHVYYALHAKISLAEKAVLAILADGADKHGRVDFSLEELADDCNLPTDEIRQCLDDLTKKHLILVGTSDKPHREIDPWYAAILSINGLEDL